MSDSAALEDGCQSTSWNSSFPKFEDNFDRPVSPVNLTSVINGLEIPSIPQSLEVTTPSAPNKMPSPRRHKFWSLFGYQHEPTIPETNEDESKLNDADFLNGTGVWFSSNTTDIKRGSITSEVIRHQLTGRTFSQTEASAAAGAIDPAVKIMEKKRKLATLKKASSFSDFSDIGEKAFPPSDIKNSTSLPCTPAGSPKLLRRSSSSSSLQDHEEDRLAMIAKHDQDLVSVNDKLKTIENKSDNHITFTNVNCSVTKNSSSTDSPSLVQKLHKWGTTSQVKVNNKELNMWAPSGGF